MATKTMRIYPDKKNMKVDAQGRLHCEDDYAYRLIPEGWDKPEHPEFPFFKDTPIEEDQAFIYCWHGIVIPYKEAQIIIHNPDKLTAQFVLGIDNIEVRRVALERLGYDKFLQQADHTVLHEDVDKLGQKRKLVKFRLPEGEEITGVFVTNSSPNGRYERVKTVWKPITDYAEHDRARILRKYEGTGDLKTIGNVVHVGVQEESGKFIPDLDKNGKLVYKQYFLSCRPDIAPFWMKVGKDGKQELDQDGDPVFEFGKPQKPTCHNAVASVHGLTGEEYDCDVET